MDTQFTSYQLKEENTVRFQKDRYTVRFVLTGIFSLPLVDVAVGVCVRGNAKDAVDGVGARTLQGGLVRGWRGVGDHGRGLGHRRQCSRQPVLRLLCRLVPYDSAGRGRRVS